MTSFTIREIRDRDAKRVLEAFREIARTSKWLLTPPEEAPKSVKEELKFIRRHRKSKNSHLAMAEIDGEVIGLVGAEGTGKRRHAHVTVVGLAIRKKWRGKGIGLKMMKYIESWAKRAGLKKLRLGVIAENKIARKLYRKMGFKQEGCFRRELKVGNRYHDTIEMAKFIRSPA
jgi:RimJ/RimL family protein N-acetyltransferase